MSADQARRQCNTWLMNEVNMGFVAENPDLILQENRALWLLPIVFTMRSANTVNVMGHVRIDVKSGEMIVDQVETEQWLAQAERLVKQSRSTKQYASLPVRTKSSILKPA